MQSAGAWTSTLWKKIPLLAKWTFLTTLLVGMLAHLPFMANHFVNSDSFSYFFQEGTPELGQGKWLLESVARMNGRTLSPNVSTTLALLMIAATAAITVCVLQIKRRVYGVLIGMLMALTPSVCCTFAYMGGAPFFTALFLSAVSVWYAMQEKTRYILLAIVFLTLSLGIYQAYIGYATGLFLLLLMSAILDGKEPVRHTLKKGCRYLGIALVAIALYYAILRILLFFQNETLSSYRNIHAIGSLAAMDFSDLGGIVLQAFKKVYFFFISDAYGTGFATMKWTYRIVLLLAAVACLVLAIKIKLYRKAGSLLLLAACTLLFPFAIHAIAILGLNADTGWRMIYPFVLVLIFLLKAADMLEAYASLPAVTEQRAGARLPGFAASISVLAVAATLAVGYQWYLVTNQCYEKMRIAYEQVYAASVELNADINRYPGFDKSTTQVAFVGDDFPELYACRSTLFDYLDKFDGVENSELIARTSRIYAFMLNFLGVDFDEFWFGDPYEKVDWSKFYDAAKLDTINAMPVYPRDGSMRLINGVLVVKMSELSGA